LCNVKEGGIALCNEKASRPPRTQNVVPSFFWRGFFLWSLLDASCGGLGEEVPGPACRQEQGERGYADQMLRDPARVAVTPVASTVAWPTHERAARLVYLRIREIDAIATSCLTPPLALEGKHPLAAVLLRRALIEVTLQKARATRYEQARHVREIDSLNAQIKNYADFETPCFFR
jgi:hypothetical protein